MRCTAVILAAGHGSRMNSEIPKQYMQLKGYPLLYHSLRTFEDSGVNDIVLVTEDVDYCLEQIVRKYRFHKVRAVVPGGSERYLSVYEGLKAVGDTDIVLIHDGARPCVTEEIIGRTIASASDFGSGVAAVPAKDTIVELTEERVLAQSLDRSRLWMVQTPQTFRYGEILAAYRRLVSEREHAAVTDDASVLERYGERTGRTVHYVEGSYRNIKVTTPEDLLIAECFCNSSVTIQRLANSTYSSI